MNKKVLTTGATNKFPLTPAKQIQAVIIQQGILPLFYHANEAVCVEVLKALYKAGAKAVEYTNRGKAARKNFKKLASIRNEEMPDMLLGIGTIKNLPDAKYYISEGADFLVSPGFLPELADYAGAGNIFYAPGCMTPAEIIAAENAGLKFIKLFPGNVLGPDYLSSIKDIFPDLFFMPTGGVNTTKENLERWFEAGVCAVGIGGHLISKPLMESKRYDTIEKNTMQLMKRIKALKNKI